MWWCCGRNQKEAPGCKYSKHQQKNDEEDEALLNIEEAKEKNKALKCFCCKEKGHKTENCDRDPNIRRDFDSMGEIRRIEEKKNIKKVNGDSLMVSTKLMAMLSKQ